MKIDVTIATKNNQDTIGDVIKAIKKHLPYNKIILVDDSDDRTPTIARELGAFVHRVEGMLGHKRIMQAKLSNTEWIACIDSDIFVYPNWYNELHKHVHENNVSSVSGYLDSDFGKVFPAYEDYMKFCSRLRLIITQRLGAIGNTLLKRDSLLLCEPYLQNIHAGEDTIIGRVFKKNNFRHITVARSVGFHWHKDAFAHHRMAYRRAGESARMSRGYLGRMLITGRFLLLQSTQLTLFTMKKMSLSAVLLRYMYYISLLYLSGLHDSDQLKSRALVKLKQIEDRLIKIGKQETNRRDT
jgi:glycosyltransferase involved in cell wall biosynthesis